MTFDAHHDIHSSGSASPTGDGPPELPLRDGRIVSPEEAARIDERRALEAKLKACHAEMTKQFDLVAEGSSIGGRLKTLADMFMHSLVAVDGDKGHASVDFGYLVVDIMKVMSSRLDALEHQARASLHHCAAKVA